MSAVIVDPRRDTEWSSIFDEELWFSGGENEHGKEA